MNGKREILPPPVRLLNENGSSPYVLICEHASKFIPKSYADLGLSEADLLSHIAWDIGANLVAGHLSELLDAPLFIAGYSRLLIDLNRPINSLTSIPELSETTAIPGNLNLDARERQRRIDTYFIPFHSCVDKFLERRSVIMNQTAVIGIHSFTPIFKSIVRPWHAGILFRRSVEFGRAIVDALGSANFAIVENQPYQIEDGSDYSVPVHGEARGFEAILIEVRQDLISTENNAGIWGRRLASALRSCEDIAFRKNKLK